MSVSDIGNWLQAGGAVGVLSLVVICLIRGWLVPGHVHLDLLRDRDDWKEVALSSVAGAEKALRLAERRRRDASREMPDHGD